ncbi:hypothetical protein [Chitinophaga tropicalis]|uniref:Uncharacterized protein n=1 Tax=Chitinophaga tropicalis TaxID=2683588 RepID=A0A7K1U996_9BACT|nr:hypothetical protein [Chitinophaga tropicalis]MVT10942.1 hypothetical protein [Chitinophaga tropicalis]
MKPLVAEGLTIESYACDAYTCGRKCPMIRQACVREGIEEERAANL